MPALADGEAGEGFGKAGAYRDRVERDDGLEVDVVPGRRRAAA
jgi:hypothetical protein